MKRLMTLLFAAFILAAAVPMFGAFTASGTGGVMTKIGATHSWYIANANPKESPFSPGAQAFKANKVYFDIVYTAGDETSVSFTVGYLYGSATPAVANVSYFPESDSSGQFSVMTRTLLKATGNQRYTVSVEVPDRASYIVITFSNTGGTPTGTIVVDGYMNNFN